MKRSVLHVVGARPQFVKASIVLRKLDETGLESLVVHTGQHYDFNMSETFFITLDIRPPDFNLGVGSSSHGSQTARMLDRCEKVMTETDPPLVIVYGDTNSTLAGALAAAKLKIPVAHVEAGLRSFNRRMPEEINRVLTDHLSDILFAPTGEAVNNLERESVRGQIHRIGDVMLDIALEVSRRMETRERGILDRHRLDPGGYILATIHREENTDVRDNLQGIMDALCRLAGRGLVVFFPVHPRTGKRLRAYGMKAGTLPPSLILSEPLPYPDMLVLEKNAMLAVTDSGGVQKEAYFFGVPSIVPRRETEWVELTRSGWVSLSEPTPDGIVGAVDSLLGGELPPERPLFYGDGSAALGVSSVVQKFVQ